MSEPKNIPLLTVERLAKRFGGIVASDDLTLDVASASCTR